MRIERLALPGLVRLEPRVHRDERGFFLERFNAAAFAAHGLPTDFHQDNHSRSPRGTLRGLHFQRPPHAQAKLVSVTRGAIYDVAVDLRRDSPTFGAWVGTRLDDEAMAQLYLPEGFAHGFLVLSEVADVLYKVRGGRYAPEAEGGLRWDDPALAIDWGVREPRLSEKDRRWPAWAEAELPAAWTAPAGPAPPPGGGDRG